MGWIRPTLPEIRSGDGIDIDTFDSVTIVVRHFGHLAKLGLLWQHEAILSDEEKAKTALLIRFVGLANTPIHSLGKGLDVRVTA